MPGLPSFREHLAQEAAREKALENAPFWWAGVLVRYAPWDRSKTEADYPAWEDMTPLNDEPQREPLKTREPRYAGCYLFAARNVTIWGAQSESSYLVMDLMDVGYSSFNRLF